MKRILTLTLTLALSACADAQTQAPKEEQAMNQTINAQTQSAQTQSDQTALSGLYRKLNEAMLAKDTATIDKLTTDDFTLTHMTGYQQSKAEWLEHIKTGKMQYHQMQEVGVNASVNGSRANIIGQAKTTATIWGAHGTWNLQLHYTATKENGVWRADKAVATLF